MKAVKFYQLNGEQKVDAVSKIASLNDEHNILQVYGDDAIAIEIEQDYNVDADFIFEIISDHQVEVSIR